MVRDVRGMIRRFLKKYLPVGDRLGEAFYAVWMVVISLGLINAGEDSEPLVLYAIFVAFLVNIGWGLIDGLSVMHTHIIDEVKNDKIVYDLRTKRDQESKNAALNAMDDTILARLDDNSKASIIDVLSSGSPGENPYKRRYYPAKEDWYYALGILLIDFLIVFPIIAPIALFGGTQSSIYLTRLIATAMFAALGAAYAKNLNRRRWVAALFLGTLGFSIFTLAYEMGW